MGPPSGLRSSLQIKGKVAPPLLETDVAAGSNQDRPMASSNELNPGMLTFSVNDVLLLDSRSRAVTVVAPCVLARTCARFPAAVTSATLAFAGVHSQVLVPVITRLPWPSNASTQNSSAAPADAVTEAAPWGRTSAIVLSIVIPRVIVAASGTLITSEPID